MLKRGMAVLLFSVTCACAPAHPEEGKAKGLDLVTDAAGALVTKAQALLSGNLEVKMDVDKDRAAKKDDYTLDATGQKVPKATVTKSGRR